MIEDEDFYPIIKEYFYSRPLGERGEFSLCGRFKT